MLFCTFIFKALLYSLIYFMLIVGQDPPILRPRTHSGFLDMQYDERYTPFLERAGLDVISFQVRRGLPQLNSAALTALVDRYFSIALIYFISYLHCE